MRDLAAQAAAHTGVDHRRHGVGTQRVRVGLDGERRAAGQPDAGVVPGAGVGVHAKALAHHALTRGQALALQRLLAPLLVEHALALRHQHLGAGLRAGQGLLQRGGHGLEIVGARDGAHPVHAHAPHSLRDGMAGAARGVGGFGGQDVLPASGRGVAVVDDEREVVGAVEHRIGDAAGQPVVPEAAVAHDADHALVGLDVERRGTGCTQPIAHGGVAHVEGRQDGEQVAADVCRDMVRAELALHQLHGGEDGPLWAAGAKARRAVVHHGRGLDGNDAGR